MADAKYTALVMTPPTAGDIFAVSQSNTSVAVTVSSIVQAVNSTIPNLNFVSSAASQTVALPSLNAFSTACTAILTAGTWLVNGMILVGRDTASSTLYSAKITDGTNIIASGQVINGSTSQTSTYNTISMNCVWVVGAGSSTFSMQAAANTNSNFIRQTFWTNAAGSSATQLTAIKIR